MSLKPKRVKVGKSWALVDAEDWGFVSRFNWCDQNGYPFNRKLGYMHRFILGYPKKHVDHADGDFKNIQKANLRVCTHKQNMRNKRVKMRDIVGMVKGVFARPRKEGVAYMGYIKVGDKQHHLGTFNSLLEAATAYNQAAKKYFGEFACLNDLKAIASKTSK